jgi:hypothetical protein
MRDRCKEMADDVRALSTLMYALEGVGRDGLE